MFQPFLVDRGYEREELGLLVGTYGMAGSIAGSLAGGVLATFVRLERALWIAGTLRAIPLVGVLALALGPPPSPGDVIAVTVAEHLFGGALTTVAFAFMMSRVDPTIGASHYTALASVEVMGKAAFGLSSGAIAEATSYPFVFAAGLTLSLAWALAVALFLAPLPRGGRGPG
jgi:hypothetical protein